MYGFGILAIFWLINAIGQLVFGIEGIIYGVCKGGPRFKLFLIMSSAFVGIFFFWSILFINPCGFYLTGSSECKSHTNDNNINEEINIDNIYSNAGDNDMTYGAVQFSGIDVFIQSIVSGSKIATNLAMDFNNQISSLIICTLSLSLFLGSAFATDDDDYCPCWGTSIGFGIASTITGFVLTIVYGVREDNSDTGMLSLGSGMLLLLIGYPIFIFAILFKYANPCKNSRFNSEDDSECSINCCGDDLQFIRCSSFCLSCSESCSNCCSGCNECCLGCQQGCAECCCSQCHRNVEEDSINQSRAASYLTTSSQGTISIKQQIPTMKDHGYKLIDRDIKKGAFGTVLFAEHTKTNKIVALKLLNYGQDEQKQRVDNEYKLMTSAFKTMKKALAKDAFLPFVEPIDFFTSDDKNIAYIVLEFCVNGDMRDYIKDMMKKGTKLSEDKCYEIIGEISSALNQMHKNRVIHADMKPENVLFTEDYKVKLGDFGLSRKLQEGRDYTSSLLGGTLAYLAPELLPRTRSNEGENQQSAICETTAVDIWALGVIIFELLTWVHPFSHGKINASSLEIIFSVQNEDPSKVPENYSDNLKNLIMRMLQKDETRRITAEQILAIPEVAAKLKK
ncbi:MAG: putative NEK protein kinase [Streblomastix strix]|uniref:non-specific serine/threonine protein kinase n=1 Tax=Streblomastix strix TaxID=222440 RepID=A0A5J4V825_9EUKA|nr:MAG: putative NEK protein kinase [Streblomastix strix]